MRMNAAQSNLNAMEAKEKELISSVQANKALLRNFPQDKKTLNDLERERAMQAGYLRTAAAACRRFRGLQADGSG